jgi:thiamine-phosphate pyrophosphorylase
VASGARVPLRGLYIILDSASARRRTLLETLHEAIAAGARLFQYRNKSGSMLHAYEEALPLRRAAADSGVLFIVNDRCDLAMALEADGVHLGQDDLPVEEARAIMGPHRLIGLSTHSPQQVQAIVHGDPDYVAFGPIFPSTSKSDHEPVVGIDGLRSVRGLTRLPLFAIGGITVQNAPSVLRAGADGVVVISAVSDAADVGAAVKALQAWK